MNQDRLIEEKIRLKGKRIANVLDIDGCTIEHSVENIIIKYPASRVFKHLCLFIQFEDGSVETKTVRRQSPSLVTFFQPDGKQKAVGVLWDSKKEKEIAFALLPSQKIKKNAVYLIDSAWLQKVPNASELGIPQIDRQMLASLKLEPKEYLEYGKKTVHLDDDTVSIEFNGPGNVKMIYSKSGKIQPYFIINGSFTVSEDGKPRVRPLTRKEHKIVSLAEAIRKNNMVTKYFSAGFNKFLVEHAKEYTETFVEKFSGMRKLLADID